ncbi:MAG: outer membrane protein assembly factor BamE [Rhodocyclaceae bacterium]|nr:outer membrane protein assembly factor BamE [Zoogloeaceae bacterium]MCP5253162.1 outer membrane protein assembly factor BamE [Zoogloeaceae bacterium]MCW5615358.1 outer membrane protein assembly factor BamE [Rhodocyclaceae bacterium]
MKPLLLLILPLLLAACAGLPRHAELQPGVSDMAEVRAAFGQPYRIHAEPDGGRTLEFSSQPNGIHCYMVRVDAAGRLVSVRDALSEAGLARVQPGMSREAVSQLLGNHRSIEFFRLSGEEVWDWNVDNRSGPGVATRFNVHFKDGRVVRTSTTYVFPADGLFEGFGS